MPYFRSPPKLAQLLGSFSRDQRWLITIVADPDAMASALALKRIMSHRVQDVTITKLNRLSRPDNLAMVRYTRLKMRTYRPAMLSRYTHFAVVDSQPTHNPALMEIPYSIIIDHHPLPETPYDAAYVDILPKYGATSTMLTEYLQSLKIRPGKLLATALQFGIKTDTDNFERHFYDGDLRAYQYLNRFADHTLLSRIARSEFHLHWLEVFAKACTNLYPVGSSGQFVYLDDVDNPDLLVNVADFFMRVYEIRWAAVAGSYKNTVVVIFRSDGISRNVGKFAAHAFGGLGSAGGHKAMARAEFPLEAAQGSDVEMFVFKRLMTAAKLRFKPTAPAQSQETTAEADSPPLHHQDDVAIPE